MWLKDERSLRIMLNFSDANIASFVMDWSYHVSCSHIIWYDVVARAWFNAVIFPGSVVWVNGQVFHLSLIFQNVILIYFFDNYKWFNAAHTAFVYGPVLCWVQLSTFICCEAVSYLAWLWLRNNPWFHDLTSTSYNLLRKSNHERNARIVSSDYTSIGLYIHSILIRQNRG